VSAKRILSAGQCGADHAAIVRTFGQHLQAEVVAADSVDEALVQLRQGGFDLVLVNRVFDADGTPGLELVKQVQADEQLRQTRLMLVSNHEDAQREAVTAGALPGFGKAALGHPQMLARVRSFLEGPG
jgi:CheY-like chemotaxis protein